MKNTLKKQINVYWEKDVPNSFKWTADSNITIIHLSMQS